MLLAFPFYFFVLSDFYLKMRLFFFFFDQNEIVKHNLEFNRDKRDDFLLRAKSVNGTRCTSPPWELGNGNTRLKE